MANRLQKMLFNLSTLSPLVFILVLVYWIEGEIPALYNAETKQFQLTFTSIALLIIMVTSAVFSFYGVFFVKTCLRKLEKIPIAIDSISSNDGWVMAVIVTYALPLSSFVFKESNLYITGVILVAAGLFLTICNTIYPNPLLLLCGYHFYKVSNIDGGGEICLLSKRDGIHNRESIKSVVCAFNYLAIEGR